MNIVAAFVFEMAGAIPSCFAGSGKKARPGSHEHGKGTRGLPRNLGDPNCSTGETTGLWVATGSASRPAQDPPHGDVRERRIKVRPEVPPSEGNEVRREGTRES
jgi:hypothetical protein